MKVKFGIVGLGHQGFNYAGFLYRGKIANSELRAVCSSNSAKKDLVEEELPGVKFYLDYEEMLKSGVIDAVIITTPHYQHIAYGKKALENDIHLLIEKPVGVYSKEARELNDLAQIKTNLSFGIIFNQRCNPLYQDLKDLIDNNELGDIRRCNWFITSWWRPHAYYEGSKWRGTWSGEGGGVLLNQSPHQLDLWQWICGMPEKIFSKVKFGYKKDIAVEDEVTALVEYANGSTGVFTTCTHDILGSDRFEIHGDLGKIIVEDGNKLIIKKLDKSEVEISKEVSREEVGEIVDRGYPRDKYQEEIREYESEGSNHCSLIENFANNILNGEDLIAPGLEGINQLILANGILLSTWLSREIDLPFDEDLYLEELNKRVNLEKEEMVK